MALPKEPPFREAMVMTSVTWLPRWADKLAEAGWSEKSGGVVSKVAVTNSSSLMMTLHVPVPVWAPLQPEKSSLSPEKR